MKRAHFPCSADRSWLLLPVLIISIISLTFLLSLTSTQTKSTSSESHFSFHSPKFTFSERDYNKLPRFAYLISGTKGDVPRLKRLLQAVYHPRNYYLLHIDLEASDSERLDLAKYVKSERVIREFGNVMVNGKANLVTYKGPTVIASTLHAVAILLKEAKDWDWFVNLSASDYPLMNQDGNLDLYVGKCIYWDLKLGRADVRVNSVELRIHNSELNELK
ncbi:putative RING-H2 finger protein ATL2J [Hibiscus syriacus]|uniref:RING-H2 finger protein ATL2J n=1 Tax=Hibiscus syriacus TaxID=106335 RepID=A0A6A3C7J8_HIBSY|nr:putative RING-H2 finger protein ATL2J [Hibiscus syriacus]